MTTKRFNSRSVLSIVCALLLLPAGMPVFAQDAAPPPEQPAAQLLSPQQLNNLVAPVALYPDSLLSQILVAATYPLEVAEAAQWLQQNRNLQGPQLVDAARQQNWDASIQALVVFPDVLNRMNSAIRWTTDLGNAFLSQQADVMNAVQHMRAQARAAGRLNSNAQQTVTTETQGDNTAIEIQPVNPQVVYVPVYNPEYIWGPPLWGYYPPLWYPAFGFGFGFGPGIYIGSFFGGLGWGGWGWGPNWFGCSIFERGFFFGHYGYHGFAGGGRFGGVGVWAHNPEHRLGVAYPNRAVASRFGGFSGRGAAAAGGRFGGQRATTPGSSFGYRGNAGANARVGGPASRGAQTGNWSHFSQTRPNTSQSFQHSAPSYQRATPSYGGNHSFTGATPSYRSNPSYGGNYARSMPSYRSTPNNGGGGYNSSHSYSSRSYSGGNHGGSGGGGVHASGGGGGFHSGGGGGGSHGGGGGGGHHR
ncbi:MAG TPA: DUF3300 domain-containing protein [Bryobacteraceae bacterium]|nr:DUF3300 domain-containing protein [Bryobacteraceae bacterium]